MVRKTESLTEEHLTALRNYADENGPDWKRRLQVAWMHASVEPILYQLRNTHGPSWLYKFELSERGLAASRADLRYGARKLGPQVSLVVLAHLMREELANVFDSQAPAIRKAAAAVAEAAERLAEELNYPEGPPTFPSESK